MKRLIRILGGSALAVVLAAGVLWFAWLPHFRPQLQPGEQYGVDVSHHQGPIDWNRVAADDISFAYIKATEGGDHVDSRFLDNWRDAAEAGVSRGAYHFFTFCTPGHVQAQNFLSTAPQDPELPPAVDVEVAGNCSRRPSAAELRQELLNFVDAVEAGVGQRVLLYVGDDVQELYPIASWLQRPLWELRFLRRPSTSGWSIWQVMSFAEVDGIEGDVGLDIMRVGS